MPATLRRRASARRRPRASRIPALSDEAVSIAEHLVAGGPIPQAAVADALHIALAAANGVDYLLTWNCRHLANASLRVRTAASLGSLGCSRPVICTPEELMGSWRCDPIPSWKKSDARARSTSHASATTCAPWPPTFAGASSSTPGASSRTRPSRHRDQGRRRRSPVRPSPARRSGVARGEGAGSDPRACRISADRLAWGSCRVRTRPLRAPAVHSEVRVQPRVGP